MYQKITDFEGTKYKIIEVSIDLFSRKGYSAVSVRELTKAAGIKESSLYNHFKSKEEILEVIYDLFQTQHAKTVPSDDQLLEIAKHYTFRRFLLEGLEIFKRTVADSLHEKMWRIFNIEQFRDVRARNIILDQVYSGTIDFLEKAFQAFIDEKKISGQNAKSLAIEYQYPIFSMMTEYLLLRYDDKNTTEVENKMVGHVEFFLKSF